MLLLESLSHWKEHPISPLLFEFIKTKTRECERSKKKLYLYIHTHTLNIYAMWYRHFNNSIFSFFFFIYPFHALATLSDAYAYFEHHPKTYTQFSVAENQNTDDLDRYIHFIFVVVVVVCFCSFGNQMLDTTNDEPLLSNIFMSVYQAEKIFGCFAKQRSIHQKILEMIP